MNRKETYNNIPEELKGLPNWMVYRLVYDTKATSSDGKPVKPKKVPFDAKTGDCGSSTDPNTWCDFETALAAFDVDTRNHGLAFSIVEPFVFVDLDNCVDLKTGEPQDWALEVVADLDSYTEFSPSGGGYHILCRSTKPLPPSGRKSGNVEMYGDKRYFTMTGRCISETPYLVEDCTDTLQALHQRTFDTPVREPAKVAAVTVSAPATSGSDDAIIGACRAAKNAEKFANLFDHGDTSTYGGDDSDADAALCAILAYRTHDADQIDRLFRQSPLMRPKWDERRGDRTYGQRTIDSAIKLQTAVPTRAEEWHLSVVLLLVRRHQFR
jgi:putative DNA primase/helicase